ncbi:MAG: UbiA family prenyltransferase [Dehalococcoidia bacterium]
MKKFLTSSRPKQVLKNFIIFVPYFFTIEKWVLLSPEKNLLLLSNMMLTFLSFTAISIIGYQINDFMDKEYDKNHPIKKNRPIVSKKISITEMILFIFTLILISIICSYAAGINITYLIISYFLLSLGYSRIFKKIPIIDILCICFFYILRMLAGTYSIEFEVSIWLYILTFFASLFIILIKRFAESKKNLDVRYPKVSIFYSLGFMPKIIKLSLFINIFVYLVYCISETLSNERNFYFFISFFIFSFGIYRYYQLSSQSNLGESPEDVIMDRYLISSVLIYLITLILVSEINL